MMNRRIFLLAIVLAAALTLLPGQGVLFFRPLLASGLDREDVSSGDKAGREISRTPGPVPQKFPAAGAAGDLPWREGVLRIKVTEKARPGLKVSDASDGTKLLGLPSLDDLNRRFEASAIRPVFSADPRHLRRHRKWGLDRWFEIRLDTADPLPKAVAAYQNDGNVEIAEPIYRKELHWLPDDPRVGEQWHYRNTGQTGGTPGADIKLEDAWELERGDPSVIVQVVDTGIDLSHPDLAPILWVNPDPDPVKNDIHGWNFADDNNNLQDAEGHGSHVSGTVAAVTNNEVGVAGVAGGSGTGDGVRIMVGRVFGDGADGGFAEAIVYGADHGAVISQHSWGYNSPGVYEQTVLDAIDYFIAEAGDYPGSPMRGGIFVNSAGNSNSSADYYPGFYPPALAVAATNHNDVRSYYSNYGDWVDIAAPGGETIFNREEGVLSTVISGYEFYQGTSMAAPHVSGVAALIASRYPGETNEFAEALLIGSADNIDALNPEYYALLGAGRLNAHRALTLTLAVIPGPGFVSSGEYGGPFSPASQTYNLINVSGADLDWTAEVSEAWVEVAPAGGTLAAGSETDIEVRLTASAAALPAGVYTDTLTVTDTTSGDQFQRGVRLVANPTLCEAVDNCDPTWNTGGDGDWFGQMEESHDGVDAAQSGAITHDQESWLETEVAGPGVVYFWWKASSEEGYDYLEFYIDGVLQDEISGETDWSEQGFELEAGTRTLRWVYSKDESVSSGRDCGWVDQVRTDPLLVPDESFSSNGEEGGPFSPAAKTYRLTNLGTTPFNWAAAVSEVWLEVSPAGGTLDPSGEVDVSVSLTAQAASLPLGLYAAVIEFSNLSSGITVDRAARLIVDAPLLHDNGSIVTHPGGGAGGADVSVLQAVLGLSTYGFGHQISAGYRVADDFPVPEPDGWYIQSLTFLPYQTGSGLESTITGVRLQIWDGVPGDPGSSVVFGDLTTDRLAYSIWSEVYRTRDDQLDNTQRPMMAAAAVVNTHLPPGTYWLDWTVGGSLASGPWAAPITILGQTTTGNARQFIEGSWSDALDGGTGTSQGFPFLVRGRVVPAPPSPTPAPTAIPTVSPVPTASPVITPTPPPPPYLVQAGGDYNGDGTSEIAIFRPATGLWAVRGQTRTYFGGAGDLPVPGDYRGNGRTEIAIFRPAAGLWAVRGSTRTFFGAAADIPVPGDYNGDGSCDIAVFRPATGLWAVRGGERSYFGTSGDLPVPGDYGGWGFSQAGIFRSASGLWAVRDLTRVYFGGSGDRPVPGIYQWYGGAKEAVQYKTQIAVFRPATGLWAIRGCSRYYFGAPGDYPLAGRFTGHVLEETGIFRSATGLWAIPGLTRAYFGGPADLPATR
ncbi:MAG: S8 family serine peptidase [Candidatus Erginobacter occultus]|nr:S8 family serine peptidase [Candidatus Erginobacter occultus]